jgi:integrase
MSSAARKLEGIPRWPGITREKGFWRYATVYYLVDGVPWEEDASEVFADDIDALRRVVEAGLQRRGKRPVLIPYAAEQWNLEGEVIKFHGFPDEMFDAMRKFALYEHIRHRWRSFSTIRGTVETLRRFFRQYGKLSPGFYLRYVYADDLEAFFQQSGMNPGAKQRMMSCLREFCTFFEKNYGAGSLALTKEEMDGLYEKYKKANKKRKEPGFDSVPERVFYPMDRCMRELIRDPMTPFDTAVTAAATLLQMWVGLRPKELRGLRRGCYYSVERDGRTLWFLRYSSPKNGGRVQDALLLPAALEAVRALERLQTRRETVYISEYLVSFWDNTTGNPENDKDFSAKYNEMLATYMAKELSEPHPWLHRVRKKGVTIYRPVLYNFRVHLYTYLIDHGKDEHWVEAHLGHLSRAMRGKYYRMKAWRRQQVNDAVRVALPETQQVIATLKAELDAIGEKRTQAAFADIFEMMK